MSSIVLIILGLALLIVGGELLVRGAVRVAMKLGVSPLLISLTLVGFGTSTPELVISIQASLSGAAGVAIGNIVGSNIANTLLILGIAAVIAPISVQSEALKRDGAAVLAASLGFAALALVLPLGRVAGGALVLALVAYTVHAFRSESGDRNGDHGAAFDKAEAATKADCAVRPSRQSPRALAIDILIALAGLALVIGGGGLLVDGAMALARAFGISETVIGLTIVAVGTAMPEIVTCALAALRRQSDIVFGTVVGSNLYNILGIGGFTGLIAPIDIPREIATFDNPVMVTVTALMVFFAWTGQRIGRREGVVLVTGYLAYTLVLWTDV